MMIETTTKPDRTKIKNAAMVAALALTTALGGYYAGDTTSEPGGDVATAPQDGAPRVSFAPSVVERKEPLSVKLIAPKMAVAGTQVDIYANAVGPAETYQFSIVPPIDGMRSSPDPSRVAFATEEDGDYILFVSVSGPNGEVASDWRALTLTPNIQEVPVPVPVEVPVDGEEREQAAGDQPPVPEIQQQKLSLADTGMTDFARAVERLAVTVQSPSLLADIPKVATAFRMASNAGMTGQLGEQGHFEYVVEYATTQLGDAAKAWEPFFAGVDNLIGALEALGLVMDNETMCLALSDAATTLERAGPY